MSVNTARPSMLDQAFRTKQPQLHSQGQTLLSWLAVCRAVHLSQGSMDASARALTILPVAVHFSSALTPSWRAVAPSVFNPAEEPRGDRRLLDRDRPVAPRFSMPPEARL